jgi:3-oxoacyl-[acyl-carrier protein] reductase
MSDQGEPAAVYPDLAGLTAVVTGGSGGIGAATAGALAANGVAVAVVGRHRTAIDVTVKAITARGGRAIGAQADRTVAADLEALARLVDSELGRIDILATFAGGNGRPVRTAMETAEHWRTVIESDLTGTFLTVSAFLPGMLARRSGVIITMSSSAARQPAGSSAAHAAAKGGILAFSRHLAGEVAEAGVR